MAWIQNLKNWERLHDSTEYMKQVYGDPRAYLKEDTKFVTEREYYEDMGFGECFHSTHSEVQCELITGTFDPKLLPFKRRIAWHFKEFCYKTSSHGIPMIGDAPNMYYRGVWICLFAFCMIMLYLNARSVVDKYHRNEKIVDIQLKFDTAPFPAVTICNLNPYKASLASDVDLVRRTLSAFDGAMENVGGKPVKKGDTERAIERTTTPEPQTRGGRPARPGARGGRPRGKRDNEHSQFFEPGYARCLCGSAQDTYEVGDKSNNPNLMKEVGGSTSTTTAEPFYIPWDEPTIDPEDIETSTALSVMEECKTDERVKYDEPTGYDDRCICAFDRGTHDTWPCFLNGTWEKTECDTCNEHAFCTKDNTNKTVKGHRSPCICAPSRFCVAYNGKTPPIEIWTYLRGGPPTEDPNFLEAMGFQGMQDEVAIVTKAKENIIFAMATLSMDVREKLSTSKRELVHKCSFNGKECNIEAFNHDRNITLTSIRAGPMYGLRMIVYVNASDYMATTESTGVRLTIHDKEDFPFPDTFGGDPRFPVPPSGVHCEAADPVARKCLDAHINELGGVHGSFRCRCQQPCDQSIYSVTYSPAKWPSLSLNIQFDFCNGTAIECNKHYKDNGAMVEVFYEQLNFEMLTESEAYGFVNLLADFGGQLGLWCGISFITCWEFFFFFVETSWMSGQHYYKLYKKKKLEQEKKRISGF
ncbi:hypothetical protein WR25_23574 [Diploscapter pachys]|uniref:Degenerin mec-4/10 cytosolic domain-containing protein n=1 Tax=Diploscapter pachys TaxID=2018661 RepID=A0A2A2JF39_9BILA|nr:hypothetical protein WR25_23574 [Diploscapter pachys]